MMWAYLAFILIGTAAVQAENCMNVPGMQGFSMSKYSGKWYEIQRNRPAAQFGGKCVSTTYSMGKNNAINVERNAVPTTGQPAYLKGTVLQDKQDPGKLTFIIESIHFTSHYTIIGGDYISWSVMWRCENGVQSIWVLTRNLQPSNALLQEAYALLDKYKINRSDLENVDHTNCR